MGRDSTINIDNSTTINHVGAAGLPVSVRELVRVFGIEDLPTVAEVDPYLLGATSSVFGRAGEYGLRDGYVARTANDVDARLAHALGGGRLVIVVGPSKTGKTRTLFEAIRAHDPGARVVWPIPETITELAAHPRITDSQDPVVVWLDDLHQYLTGRVSLTPAALARLSARTGSTVVMATLRSEMRAQLRAGGELGQETRMLLEQALTIDLGSTSDDPTEQAAAARAYPGQSDEGYGLAEVLAGAPELLARYDDARAADPALYSVIAAAIDWARIGRTDPIPESVLADLTLHQLRADHPHLEVTAASVRAATTVARTPPAGAGRTAALHTSYLDDHTRGYRAFDYLIAADDGQDHRTPRPIPNTYWHNATRDTDTDTLLRVGLAAYQRTNTSTAMALLRKAAEAKDTGAMAGLGLLFVERGDQSEAEAWFRKAAEGGNTNGMYSLGVLFVERGEVAEAESWYRKAAEAGSASAMYNLGVLFVERGEVAEAESWYRKAIEAGSASAMYNLGVLFVEHGDQSEAEAWFRKAIEAGHIHAMYSLGVLFVERGEVAEAEAWFRKAIEDGDTDGMVGLGVLFVERGEVAEAEAWFRKAAEAGNTVARNNLGLLLKNTNEDG